MECANSLGWLASKLLLRPVFTSLTRGLHGCFAVPHFFTWVLGSPKPTGWHFTNGAISLACHPFLTQNYRSMAVFAFCLHFAVLSHQSTPLPTCDSAQSPPREAAGSPHRSPLPAASSETSHPSLQTAELDQMKPGGLEALLYQVCSSPRSGWLALGHVPLGP